MIRYDKNLLINQFLRCKIVYRKTMLKYIDDDQDIIIRINSQYIYYYRYLFYKDSWELYFSVR